MRSEPAWWAEARALREEGLSWGAIGERLGRARETIRYACDPSRRAYIKRTVGRIQGEARKTASEWQRGRWRILRKAHAEAADTGMDLDAILRSWREPPRMRRGKRFEHEGRGA